MSEIEKLTIEDIRPIIKELNKSGKKVTHQNVDIDLLKELAESEEKRKVLELINNRRWGK